MLEFCGFDLNESVAALLFLFIEMLKMLFCIRNRQREKLEKYCGEEMTVGVCVCVRERERE